MNSAVPKTSAVQPTLKALLFDVDGTMADTEEAHRSAFNAAFAKLGLDWNWSKPKYAHLLLTTGGKERLRAYIDTLGLGPSEREALNDRVGEMHRTKTELYTAMLEAGEVPLRDGVVRLMDEARQARLPIGIASTTTLANIEALLRVNLGADALGRFDAIGAGDQVPRKKPAPDIYEAVLRELRVQPKDAAAVEDSANGLASAKAAGLFTIVTPSFWTQTEDFSGADMVLPTLGSAARPLPARAAALVGSRMLGIRDIERHMNSMRDHA